MKLIPLTRGKFAKVSDHQFERIAQFCVWHYAEGYAACSIEGRTIRMHHLILPSKPGFLVDHRDGDGLNNQDYNLRYVNRSQHLQNSKRRSDNKSGVKGVSRRGKRWLAYIRVNGKLSQLGAFGTLEEAAAARKEAEQKYFGEFACQNPERPRAAELLPVETIQPRHQWRMRNDNTSGTKGVCWDKIHQRWQVMIWRNGKAISVGYFREKADAVAARKQAELEVYGAGAA